MTDRDNIDELELLALADGFLDDDPTRKAEVEAAVAQCPKAAARLSDYRAQTAALRAAYAGVLAAAVPKRLHAAVDGADRTRGRPVVRRAAAGLLIVAAGVGGWFAGQDDDDPTRRALLDESYRQFVLRGPEQSPSATNATASVTESSISWIDDDVAIRLSAPDLSSEGFTLIGKRGVRASEDQLVALEYMSQDGRAFSLIIAPRWADRPGQIVDQERDGVSLAYWHDGPLAASIATHLPPEQARLLAQSVRRAMRDKTATPPTAIEPEYRSLEDPVQGVMADSLGARSDTLTPEALQGPAPAALEAN